MYGIAFMILVFSHVYTDLGHRFDNDTPIEETVCILT